MQSENQAVQLVPQILQSPQEIMSVFIKKKCNKVVLVVVIDRRSSIYFAVDRQLIGTSSDTHFLKFHTVLCI